MRSTLIPLFALLLSIPAAGATCTGSPNCRACRTCSRCQHCAVLGGTCGVKTGGRSDYSAPPPAELLHPTSPALPPSRSSGAGGAACWLITPLIIALYWLLFWPHKKKKPR